MTPLVLLESPEDFKPEPEKRYALLSYRGEGPYVEMHAWESVEALSPGSGKLAEAAIRLFHVMRVLDESGVDRIVAEPVMARLRRAAAVR